jgi:hypothetical protein
MARIPDAFIDDRAAATLTGDGACRAAARRQKPPTGWKERHGPHP